MIKYFINGVVTSLISGHFNQHERILYGTENYSKGHQLCSHSTVSQHSMQPEGS
jgi:hypothetical protein